MLLARDSSPPPAQAAVTDAPLDAAAAAVMPQVIDWRRDFHQNPELGNREFRTSKIVAEHLRQLGLEVQTGIAHTGVVGVLQGRQARPDDRAARGHGRAAGHRAGATCRSSPTATAEYRGEKVGVMHACGHDGTRRS